MRAPEEGRWPPVYDAEDLAEEIRELAAAEDFDARFWTLRAIDGTPCQGDVVQLAAEVPLLDETGGPWAADDGIEHWLLIGNTCDFVRDLDKVPYTQLAPIVDVGKASLNEVRDFRSYLHSRRFYLPPWPSGDEHHRFADFTRPVTIDKRAFGSHARVVARMDHAAWVLLHSCLIRFLARDDGRFD